MYRSVILIIDSVLVCGNPLLCECKADLSICQVFRCWLIFAKLWRFIYLPLGTWTFSLIGAIVQSCCDARTWASSYPIEETALCKSNGMLEMFYFCNVFTSIYATCMSFYLSSCPTPNRNIYSCSCCCLSNLERG